MLHFDGYIELTFQCYGTDRRHRGIGCACTMWYPYPVTGINIVLKYIIRRRLRLQVWDLYIAHRCVDYGHKLI